MHSLKTYLILLFIGLFSMASLKGQDPQFSQFYANQLYLNPAFAGTQKCPRLGLNYRNQWPGIAGTFVTQSIAYDQYVDGLNGGIGIYVMQDGAGKTNQSGFGAHIFQTTRVAAMFSKPIPVNNRFSFNLALEGAYEMKRFNQAGLVFPDQIDPSLGAIGQSLDPALEGGETMNVDYPDFSAGFLGYSEKFFFGVAAHHLVPNLANQSFLNGEAFLPMKITGHMGANLDIPGLKGGNVKEEGYISPNVLYQQQQDFQQLNLGLYVRKGQIVSGVWFRNSGQSNDAIIALVGFDLEFMKIGYSYDLTISRLGGATAGSHEVSTQFQFRCKPKKRKYRTIQCPSF